MTGLRRLLGLPRLPTSIYILTLALLLAFAYLVTGRAHEYGTKLASSFGSFYAPTGMEPEGMCWHDYIEAFKQEKR